MNIKIFTTGGTIDKIYFDANSQFHVGAPQIGDLLREANVVFDYTVESVLRKDSLELTDQDRALIRDKVANDPAEHVLITHGTDSMVDTAMVLTDIPGKTIVLTGSMQPARQRVSDAIFNIGYAIGALQLAPPGVYLAINGKLFDPRHTHKNWDAQCFEQDD